MPHLRYSSGSVRAVTKLRTMLLASVRPPMSVKEVSGLTFTSTRPVSSASFSPSLPKISPRRRSIAHCCPSTLCGGRAGALSADMALDLLPGSAGAAGDTLGLLEHAILREDGHLRADGQRDRVGRTRVELHRGSSRGQVDRRVVGVVAQIRDDHLGDRDLE